MFFKKNNIPVFKKPEFQAAFYFLLFRHIEKQNYHFFTEM